MTTPTKLTALVAVGRLAFGIGLIAALAGLLLYAALDQ
jgi:hypothetical protein